MRLLSAGLDADLPRLVYGTSDLEDACAFAVRAGGRIRPRAVTTALRGPRQAVAFLRLSTLPVLELPASAHVHDRWRSAVCPGDRAPLFEGYWAQAVISTAADEREYLRGRSRQAVRTNIRRAYERGVRCECLDDYGGYVRAAADVYPGRAGGAVALAELRSREAPAGFAWYAATASDGRAVAIGAVALFGEFAVLGVLVGDPRFPVCGHVHYLLHTRILVNLAERGAQTLVAGSVLSRGPGLRYLQSRLGYRVCNLAAVVVGGGSSTLSRRFMRGPTVAAQRRDVYQA